MRNVFSDDLFHRYFGISLVGVRPQSCKFCDGFLYPFGWDAAVDRFKFQESVHYLVSFFFSNFLPVNCDVVLAEAHIEIIEN